MAAPFYILLLGNLFYCIIGFDRGSDVEKMKSVMPNLKEDNVNFLYLQEFWKKLDGIAPEYFPYPIQKSEPRGLTDLAKLALNKHKDKGPQVSVWSNRPLRPDQAQYGAIDAHCLLQIFEAMRKIIESKTKYNFNDLVFGGGNDYCEPPEKLSKGQRQRRSRQLRKQGILPTPTSDRDDELMDSDGVMHYFG